MTMKMTDYMNGEVAADIVSNNAAHLWAAGLTALAFALKVDCYFSCEGRDGGDVDGTYRRATGAPLYTARRASDTVTIGCDTAGQAYNRILAMWVAGDVDITDDKFVPNPVYRERIISALHILCSAVRGRLTVARWLRVIYSLNDAAHTRTNQKALTAPVEK